MSVAEFPKLSARGVSYTETPGLTLAYVEACATGPFVFRVDEFGELDEIKDSDGKKVASFDKNRTVSTKSCFIQHGTANLSGLEVDLSTRKSYDAGENALTVFPRRIYFDPAVYKTEDDVKELFRQRACYAASILALNGWKLSDNPEFHGSIKCRVVTDFSDVVCCEAPRISAYIAYTLYIGNHELHLTLDEARELKGLLQRILPPEADGESGQEGSR